MAIITVIHNGLSCTIVTKPSCEGVAISLGATIETHDLYFTDEQWLVRADSHPDIQTEFNRLSDNRPSKK